MSEFVTIHDIHKRLRNISKRNDPLNESKYIIFRENASNSIKNNIPKDIMKSIEYACKNTNPIMFESVLDLFDALYECGTTGQLVKMCNYICEEAVTKVRNAKDTNTNLKRKLGRMKSKISTKINNNIEDAKEAIQNSINGAKVNLKTNTTKIKTNIYNGTHIKKKNEVYIECYEKISKALSKCEDCDRILENYNIISKRFNLEKLFVENTRVNGVQDTVIELCKFIETYEMKDIVKFNTVIETAWYGFEQNGIEYSTKEMLEAATDYFSAKQGGNQACEEIFKNTSIFNKEDFPERMQVITELDPETNTNYDSVFKTHEEIKNQIANTESSILMEDYDFNKIFNNFKAQDSENKETQLKSLIRKLYTKNVSNIVDGTPNLLNWIRYVFILGTFGLNAVLGAVVFIGDIFVRLDFERDETEKMIKCFESEIKKSETKMKSTNNTEEKQRLKEYIKALNKAKDKINDYYERMLTEKEIDNKYSVSDDKDSFDDLKADITGSEEDDDDFDDWDFDDDDEDFLEAAVNTIMTVDNLIDNINQYDNIGTDTITHMSIFNGDDIENLAKLSVMYPDIWSPELMESMIESQIFKIRKGKVVMESFLERFQVLNAYDTAIKTIHSYKPDKIVTIGESIDSLIRLSDSVEAINTIIYTNKNKNLMVEASFTNSLKMASEKLKKTITKLSDKDKTISSNVDVSLSQFRKSVENSLTNDNREAIIRGSVLPSASKIIKLAIINGALWLVDPALSVITALGYLGLSAKHKNKERQLILDELDVELKMCEKYIDIAESKNDMKSLKQLMMIQKNLKRQEQRIRYKMKVDFNQNIPKTDE